MKERKKKWINKRGKLQNSKQKSLGLCVTQGVNWLLTFK